MTYDPRWLEEARGIPVWGGALLLGFPRMHRGARVLFVCDDGMGVITDITDGRSVSGRLTSDLVPDLLDPDTLAAFDRRLALRLGAPAENVAEGVLFYLNGGVWVLTAGAPDRWWWRHSNDGRFGPETDCPILARVRAWRTVT